MWLLSETLDRLVPHLPPALAPRDALARVRAVADRLPAPLTGCLYLERLLASGAPRLDLIVRVEAEAHAVLARLAREQGESWRRLASFARNWGDGAGGLAGPVEAVWLEFDLPEGAAAAEAVPRVFVDFTRAAAREGAAADRFRLATDVLARLAPQPPHDALVGTLRDCFDALPPGAHVPYIGLSLVHGGGARVCVQGLDAGLTEYLRRVGWPGDREVLARDVLDPLARAKGVAAERSVHVLHLDLAPAVEPRLGLEYALARADQRRGALREADFVGALAARGWCEPALGAALSAWPGSADAPLAHTLWPSRVERRVNHVKVAWSPAGPVEAKAYLAALVVPRTDATVVDGRVFVARGAPADARQPGAIE